MQNKAPNAMDLGPKFIIAFQREPDSRCGKSFKLAPAGGRGENDGTTTIDTDQH
jgi:hypothetical protein